MKSASLYTQHLRTSVLGRTLCCVLPLAVCFFSHGNDGSAQSQLTTPVFASPGASIEERVNDLLRRMTLEEKVRQLDLYSGAKELMNKLKDPTHAAPDAAFLANKAQMLWGNLGVGAIHDLYPTPQQANAIQGWVVSHNRFGISALFIEEGLHVFYTGTVFL